MSDLPPPVHIPGVTPPDFNDYPEETRHAALALLTDARTMFAHLILPRLAALITRAETPVDPAALADHAPITSERTGRISGCTCMSPSLPRFDRDKHGNALKDHEPAMRWAAHVAEVLNRRG